MRRGLVAGAAVLVLAGGLYAKFGRRDAEQPVSADASDQRKLPVVVQAARVMQFEERLVLSGNVIAKNRALVSPKVNGTLDAIMVEEGDAVVAGETKLFQTDPINLGNAVEVARQQHEVARCTVLTRQAELERAAVEHRKASLDYTRYKKLFADSVISRNEYESQEVASERQEALLKQARVAVTLAEEQLKQAALNLSITEKNLLDSLVLAPISGVVARRDREPGEMGQTGTPVLEIQDLSVLEVSVYLPEEYFPRVESGVTLLRLRAGSLALGMHPVSYKSPCVSSDLRTFEVKALLENPPAGVAPGRIATVEVILRSAEGVGVGRDAIVTRGGEAYLFTVQDGKARAVRVSPELETDGFVHVPAEVVPVGTPVIVEGQDFVDDGLAVQSTGEER